jgi:hypothetical protein
VIGHPTTTRYSAFDAYYYQHRAFKMDTRELAIQSAMDDLRAGVFTSQRKAAKAYGIP